MPDLGGNENVPSQASDGAFIGPTGETTRLPDNPQSLYIGEIDGSDPDLYLKGDEIWDWLSDRIPPPPPGQLCENPNECRGQSRLAEEQDPKTLDDDYPERPLATGFWVTYKAERACWTYICDECAEIDMDEKFDFTEIPQDESGHAAEPVHCST